MGYMFEMAQAFVQLTGQQEEGTNKQLEAIQNQGMARDAAADAIARGNREAGLLRIQGTQAQAATRAGYAGAGVDTTVGTPVQAAEQNAYFSELDAKTAENNAAREAWGFRTYGVKYGQQAGLEASRTQNRALTTILGGARDLGGYAARDMKKSAEDDYSGDW